MSSHDNNNSPSKNIIYCRWGCGKGITFDDRMVSKNGIKIPLDHDSRLPHECPNRNQRNLKLKTQSIDQNSKNFVSVSREHYFIVDQIFSEVKKGREDHHQIGIDIYHVTNELEEIKQILKDLTNKFSSPSFDESRYR